MERQYLKLMDMIAAIVGTLDKREMFQSIITHSGRQHAQFGAKPASRPSNGSFWFPNFDLKSTRTLPSQLDPKLCVPKTSSVLIA